MTHKTTKKYKRHPDDWYVEPPAATEFILKRERFRGVTLDPCCGQGNIVQAFLAAGHQAVGMDLRERAPGAEWFLGTHDFLNGDLSRLPAVQNIAFNPPFFRGAGSEKAIRRALELPVLKVAAFVPMRFLFGDRRTARFWKEVAPSRIYPVFPRPSCPPGDFLEDGGKAEGGTDDFVWLIWDLGTPRGTTRFVWAPLENRP